MVRIKNFPGILIEERLEGCFACSSCLVLFGSALYLALCSISLEIVYSKVYHEIISPCGEKKKSSPLIQH